MAPSASGSWRPASGVTGKAFLLAALAAPLSAQALFSDRVELFVSENVTYDTNVFRLSKNIDTFATTGSTERADWVSTTGLGINVNLPVSLQRFELNYTWFTSKYKRFGDLDHDGRSGRAVWNWAVTPRITGDLGYQEDRALASFANIQGRRPDLVTSRMAFANGAWMVTPSWRAHAVLGAAQTEHEDPTRAANDLETGAVETGLSYVTAQDNRIGGAVRGERGRSPHTITLFGVPFDNAYNQYGAGVQFRWVLTGLSRFDGRADWTKRTYDQFTQRNFSGPTARITYTYTPTGKLTIATIAQRDIAPIEDITTRFVLVSGLTVRPDWAVTDKFNVRGILGYSIWDYQGDPVLGADFKHRVRTAGVSVIYRPTPHIGITGGLTREVRTSTLLTGDYEATTAFIEGRVGF